MKKYLPFILIAMVILLIFGFSSQSGETSNSLSRTIATYLKRILDQSGYNGYSVDKIHLIIRKLAHFTEYLFLSVLLVVGLSNLIKRFFLSGILSGIICVTLSLTDEIFQGFSYNRTSSYFDVFIDSCGAFVGLASVTLVVLLSTRMIPEKNLDRKP